VRFDFVCVAGWPIAEAMPAIKRITTAGWRTLSFMDFLSLISRLRRSPMLIAVSDPKIIRRMARQFIMPCQLALAGMKPERGHLARQRARHAKFCIARDR